MAALEDEPGEIAEQKLALEVAQDAQDAPDAAEDPAEIRSKYRDAGEGAAPKGLL